MSLFFLKTFYGTECARKYVVFLKRPLASTSVVLSFVICPNINLSPGFTNFSPWFILTPLWIICFNFCLRQAIISCYRLAMADSNGQFCHCKLGKCCNFQDRLLRRSWGWACSVIMLRWRLCSLRPGAHVSKLVCPHTTMNSLYSERKQQT